MMKLTFLQHLSLILLLLADLLGCDSTAPEGPPTVIDTIFVSPPGDSPLAVGVNAQSGYVYVGNRNDLVSVLKEDRLVTTLPVGDQSTPALAVDEKRDRVYVLSEYDDTVTIIKGTEVVATLEVAGRSPLDVAVEPQRGRAYVIAGYRKVPTHGEIPVVEGHLTAIDNDQISGVLTFEGVLTDLVVVDPLGGYVYLGAVGGQVIVVKDMQEVARYNMQSAIVSMDADPRTGEVYALYHSPDNHHLSRFGQGKLIDSIPVKGKNGSLYEVRVHPTTGLVYVMDIVRRELVVVQDMAVVDRVQVDWRPRAMAIDPLTGNVYVTGIRSDTVTVVQGTEVLTTTPVGWKPFGLGINPVNGRVYVANTAEDSVTILGFDE